MSNAGTSMDAEKALQRILDQLKGIDKEDLTPAELNILSIATAATEPLTDKLLLDTAITLICSAGTAPLSRNDTWDKQMADTRKWVENKAREMQLAGKLKPREK